MPSMTKRVNVTTTIPVRTITPPLNGTYKNIIMSTGDILKCISRRAIVDEILPNGMTIRLTIGNYYKDNGAGLDAAERAVASKIKDEEHVELPKSEEKTSPVEKEEKAPEVPVEPDDSADNETATSAEEETGANETAVVETTNEETEPEASVEHTADVGVAQAAEEPPVDEEGTKISVNNEAEAVAPAEENKEEKPASKKSTTKKGSSKKGTTKKVESTEETTAIEPDPTE